MIPRACPRLVCWLAALAPVCASAADRVIVAWDDPSSGAGRVAAIDATPPFGLASPTLAVGGDGRVRADAGVALHLSRASGELTAIDPDTWTVLRVIPLGAASQPRDVAIVDATTAWVSSAAGTHLRRVDLETGSAVDALDLSPLGVGDGSPLMETLLAHEGRLYVQLAAPAVFPPEPSFVAIVDLASETLVDADPSSPGVQGILLEGTAPRFKMQAVPGTDQLLVSATGSFHDFGGLELLDLTTLTSLGVAVREWEDVGGNDLGAFAMIDDERGWLVFSTDIVLSSHLHPFTLSDGGDIFEADTSLFYFAPHLVYDDERDILHWPEPGGVQAFDGTSGDALAPATALSGDPTDLALLRAPRAVPALPAWGVLLLLPLPAFARAPLRRLARRRRRTRRAPDDGRRVTDGSPRTANGRARRGRGAAACRRAGIAPRRRGCPSGDREAGARSSRRRACSRPVRSSSGCAGTAPGWPHRRAHRASASRAARAPGAATPATCGAARRRTRGLRRSCRPLSGPPGCARLLLLPRQRAAHRELPACPRSGSRARPRGARTGGSGDADPAACAPRQRDALRHDPRARVPPRAPRSMRSEAAEARAGTRDTHPATDSATVRLAPGGGRHWAPLFAAVRTAALIIGGRRHE